MKARRPSLDATSSRPRAVRPRSAGLEEQAAAVETERRTAMRRATPVALCVLACLALPLLIPAVPVALAVVIAASIGTPLLVLAMARAMREAEGRMNDELRRAHVGRVACADCGAVATFGAECPGCGTLLPLPEELGIDGIDAVPPRPGLTVPPEHQAFPYWVRVRRVALLRALAGAAFMLAMISTLVWVCGFVLPRWGWVPPGMNIWFAPIGATMLAVSAVGLAFVDRTSRRTELAGIAFLVRCRTCRAYALAGGACPACGGP